MIGALLVALLAQAPAAPSFRWSDGRAARTAWPDPMQLAELAPSPEGEAVVRALDPKAVSPARSARVRLWQLSGAHATATLAALEARAPGKFAAVFHDEPSSASKLRVPAGGVLVWLAASVDAPAWAAQRKLVVERSFGGGVLLVSSGPGRAALQLSESLRVDPSVRNVMPNWWFRAYKR